MSRHREKNPHLFVVPLDGVNVTTAKARRRVICKEKLDFPAEDWRISRSIGKCHVEKQDILLDMLGDGAFENTQSNKVGFTSIHHNFSKNNVTNHSSSDKNMMRQTLQEHRDLEISNIEQLKKMSITKQNETAQRKKDVMFSNLVKDIADSVDLMDSIDKSILWIEETKRSKSKRLFDDWNSRVHDPIQVNIANQVKLIDSKKLNKKKNEDYDNFLSISNRKSAIFRDIIIESEYDPLEPNRRGIVAKMNKFADPTKFDAQKAEEEGSMLNGKKTEQKLGRYTLNAELWATGKIEATPHGVAMKMINAVAVPRSVKSKSMESSLKFDHYDFPKGDDAVQKEMPRGKKTQNFSDSIPYKSAERIFGATH